MKKIVTILIYLILFTTFSYANSLQSKKVGLVLSGGGVKGFGHIGALHLLDSLNIKIDYIAGSSIGAITAALYATGHSIEEINQIALTTNWDEVFGVTRKRNQLYYFKKKDADKFQLSFSLKDLRPIPPISLSNGQYSYEHLSDIFINYSNAPNYDNLVIPFRFNATDLITGEEIIFKNGSIPKNLRISTSIPTIFSPIEHKNSLLVDGGLVNNLPTNLVEDLGADYIIASNVMSEERSKDDINDIFSVIYRLINLYGKNNEKVNLLKSDLLINPNFKNMSVINADPIALKKMEKEGKKAAYKEINELIELSNTNPLDNKLMTLTSITSNKIKIDSIILSKDLLENSLINNIFSNNMIISKDSLVNKIKRIRRSNQFHNLSYKFYNNSDSSYDMYLNGKKNKDIIINIIQISGNNSFKDNEIIEMFSIKKNDKLDIIKLNHEINQAYKTGFFHYINYDIAYENNNTILNIAVKENPNKQIKLGALWDNHYKLIGKLKLNILNKPTNKFRIENELLFSGFKRNRFSIYYSITKENRTILIPYISLTNTIKKIGLRNINHKLNFIKHDSYSTSFGFIVPFKKYGSLKINQNIMDNSYSSEIFNLTGNNFKFYGVQLDIDQLDNLSIPKYGFRIAADYHFNNENNDFNYINIKSEYFTTINYLHTLRFSSWYKKSTDNTPIYLESSYGGYNWAIGYEEFMLSSFNLNIISGEYQFHYKNSTTIKFIINKLITIDEINDGPINLGLGLSVKSILGPINFMWGRGHVDPFNKNSKRHNIFYFNFGVEL